jgi:hypothetical protein
MDANVALGIGFMVASLMHVLVFLLVFFDRLTGPKKLLMAMVVWCVPIIGPLYYLLFVRTWSHDDR